MLEPYYFEIPIYRCDLKTHSKEMKLKEGDFTREDWKETAPISYQNMINIFHRRVWYSWKYNEVIGWINLYILGSQVRGDYYFITSKRIGKGVRKKKFQYYGKAFEHSLPKDMTSNEIFEKLLYLLERLNKKEKPFKNRYIDLDAFKTIGEFIDWKTLVEKLNSFQYPRKNNNYA